MVDIMMGPGYVVQANRHNNKKGKQQHQERLPVLRTYVMIDTSIPSGFRGGSNADLDNAGK